MDDCHFINIVKINKTFIPNYIKENKTCNSSKNGYILHNENHILKISNSH